MAEFIDPWGGMKQGVQTLRDTAESQGLQRARNLQNESAAIDLGMKQATAPRMRQAAMEDITARIDDATMKQIGSIAEASRFVRGNPAMAKEVGDKMGVSPDMLMSIKEIEPNIHTLDLGDGNTVVVARDAKGGMKVMKTTDPQLAQKHEYRMEENQAKYTAQLANSLAGIAARGAQKDASGGTSGLTAEEQEALIAATQRAENPLPINMLSKTSKGATVNKIIAQGLMRDPNFDYTEAVRNANIAKSPVFANKAITVQAMPVILDEVVKAGKKLDYPQAKFAGVVQQWTQGQLNDPDLVAYMTLRNDALLSIASVMRGTGATDQAHKVEMEAMNPTLTPQALDAWIGAQKTALKPRMDAYDKIYGKKTPIAQPEGMPAPTPQPQGAAVPPDIAAPPAIVAPAPVAAPTDRVYSQLPPNTQAAVRNTPEYKNAKPGEPFQVKGKSGIITIIKR